LVEDGLQEVATAFATETAAGASAQRGNAERCRVDRHAAGRCAGRAEFAPGKCTVAIRSETAIVLFDQDVCGLSPYIPRLQRGKIGVSGW